MHGLHKSARPSRKRPAAHTHSSFDDAPVVAVVSCASCVLHRACPRRGSTSRWGTARRRSRPSGSCPQCRCTLRQRSCLPVSLTQPCTPPAGCLRVVCAEAPGLASKTRAVVEAGRCAVERAVRARRALAQLVRVASACRTRARSATARNTDLARGAEHTDKSLTSKEPAPTGVYELRGHAICLSLAQKVSSPHSVQLPSTPSAS